MAALLLEVKVPRQFEGTGLLGLEMRCLNLGCSFPSRELGSLPLAHSPRATQCLHRTCHLPISSASSHSTIPHLACLSCADDALVVVVVVVMAESCIPCYYTTRYPPQKNPVDKPVSPRHPCPAAAAHLQRERRHFSS